MLLAGEPPPCLLGLAVDDQRRTGVGVPGGEFQVFPPRGFTFSVS
jgi:hypothetical protein